MFRSLKSLLIVALLTINSSGFSQSLMFGFGGTYGTDIQQFAPNFRIYYGLSHEICFGPEYSYFPSTKHGDYDVQLNEFGWVIHYIFHVKEKAAVYPLLGLNYSIEKESINESMHQTSALGAAFGLGFHWNADRFLPFIEYKFITGKLSQSTISMGLIYNLKLGKKDDPIH